MKTKYTFATLACIILALTSCNDDLGLGNNNNPAEVGDEIVFGGTMQFGSNSTRTVYGDEGKLDNKNYTEIKWYQGDVVRIFSADAIGANGVQYCDYKINDYIAAPTFDDDGNITSQGGDPTDEKFDIVDEASMEHADDETIGLRWGSQNAHTFYGVYPSPDMLKKYSDDAVAANALKIEERNKVTAYLPNLQRPTAFVNPEESDSETTTDKDGNTVKKKHYTIHPSMRYAYMVANEENVLPTSDGVNLTFEPIVTALEMTLVNNSKEAISGITMISLTSDEIICGNFSVTISSREISNNVTDDSYRTVSIPTAADGSSITLNPGDKITFTAFLTLKTDINKLGVTIVYADGLAKKSATLTGGTGVTIVQAKKKNFIASVGINFDKAVQSVDIANWMAALDDATTISSLSIPGAGGASSGAKSGDSYVVADNSRQQNLNITELWNNGIRCFEFFVDNGSDFGNQNITCNGVSTGVTLNTAVNTISSLLLNNPEELAVIIVGYEEAYNNVTEYSRNAGQYGFGHYFNSWWNGYSYTETIGEAEKTITKDKILPECSTLAEARGRLFCIGRTVSIGIDPGWYTGIYCSSGSSNNNKDYNCLYILGWGNNPDQWYARGFGNLVVKTYLNSSVPAGENTSGRPYALSSTKTGLAAPSYSAQTTSAYYTDNNKSTATIGKYIYKATQYTHRDFSNAEYDVMVQEWRRVMPNVDIQTQYNISSPEGKAFKGLNNSSTDYYSAWSPSVEEKWDDVISTFTAATDKTGDYDLYINSLCGYFIDGNIALSYQPRPTFQRFYIHDGWFSDCSGIYLDDKHRDYGSNSDNPGEALASKTSPKKDTDWGPYNPLGGYQGNIAAFADWINNKFYNYLLGTTITGSTGIIMMDRVSNDVSTNPAGYYIPRIILANNPFPEGSGLEEASTMRLSLLDGDQALDTDNSDGVVNQIAAPARR